MRTVETPCLLLILLLTLLTATPAAAGEETAAGDKDKLPTLAEKTEGLEARRGFLDLWMDGEKGRVYLELPAAGETAEDGRRGVLARALWVEGIATGLGSNPVGLDRGQLGDTRVVAFRRLGGKVVLEVENPRFRAASDNPAERRAVGESFATSVVWAGEVAAKGPGDGGGERLLIDLTPFLLTDAHGVARRLEARGEGTWSLDSDKSAADPAACLVFPDNVELKALLTWTGKGAGVEVRRTSATPEAITLVAHHSFIRLPGEGFTPRRFDPRAGFFGPTFRDYAAPLDAPVEAGFIARHRRPSKDPATGEVEPIVFHVDPGAPEAVRRALAEGASWWAEAFAAAGFPGGFRVVPLPEGAHLLDVRYNVIQWVHRETRGWSFGGGIVDPRTGEILKGHVNLGSLRVRQDRLLFEGLLGTENTGTGEADDPVELALARLRQLAAHEVGHALGLTHNFAASTYGRASVMDYPAPLVRLGEGGGFDVSRAYAVGVGEWDVEAIRWGYGELPPGAEGEAELERLLRGARERGLLFVTDEDARPLGSAHPLAHLWDNGADPVAELAEVMAVRRAALARFGEGNVAPGRPLARLHEVLVPVYLWHRYQLTAAVKVLAGLDYTYAMRGDGGEPARPVPAERQRAALEAVLAALAPEELDLPEEVLGLLLPRPPGHPPNRELFPGATGLTFDPLAAAAVAADMALAGLLEPHRAARLVDQNRRDPSLPGLEEVLDALVGAVFAGPPEGEGPRRAEVRRTVETSAVAALVGLVSNAEAPAAVRARTEAALRALRGRLAAPAPAAGAEGAHRTFLAGELARFLDRTGAPAPGPVSPPPAPPGQPIGAGRGMEPSDFLSGCSRQSPSAP